MTAATIQRNSIDWKKVLSVALPLAILLLGVIVFKAISDQMWLASQIGAKVANPLKHEGVAFFWMVGITLIWGVLTACLIWEGKSFQKRVNKIAGFDAVMSLWLAAVFIVPPVFQLGYNFIVPARLATPAGYYRITEDHQLLTPDDVVPTNRYVASSKVVPEYSTGQLSFSVVSPAGYKTDLTMNVAVVLKGDAATRDFLSQHYAELAWNTDENHLYDMTFPPYSSKALPQPIADAITWLLSNSARDLITGLEKGDSSGSSSILILKSRQSAEKSIKSVLPPWAKSITVSDVGITNWSKSQ